MRMVADGPGDRLIPPGLAERFQAGEPVEALAAEAGVSVSTIYRRLYEAIGPLVAARQTGREP